MAGPPRARSRPHRTEHEGRHDRQEAVDQHGGNDAGVLPPKPDEGRRQAQLDDPEPAGGDRDRAEQPGQRPAGERLDHADLAGIDPERAQAGEEHEEDRSCPRASRA